MWPSDNRRFVQHAHESKQWRGGRWHDGWSKNFDRLSFEVRNVSLYNVMRIAKALGTSAEELFREIDI